MALEHVLHMLLPKQLLLKRPVKGTHFQRDKIVEHLCILLRSSLCTGYDRPSSLSWQQTFSCSVQLYAGLRAGRTFSMRSVGVPV